MRSWQSERHTNNLIHYGPIFFFISQGTEVAAIEILMIFSEKKKKILTVLYLSCNSVMN